MEESIKITLSNIFCVLAEKVITRVKPYETIELCYELAPTLKLFYENGDTLNAELREEYIRSLVTVTKARIESDLGVLEDSVATAYPNEYETIIRVGKDLRQPAVVNIGPHIKSKSEVNQILLELMEATYPEYKLKNKRITSNTLTYSRKIGKENSLFIVYDHGTYRQWTDMYIGMEFPKFHLDIAKFFGGVNSIIKYDDLASYRNDMGNILRIVRPVIDNIYSEISAKSTP